MIKGPYKYNKALINIAKIVSLFVIFSMLFVKVNRVDYSLKISSIISTLFYGSLTYGIAWLLIYKERQLFHTPAKNRITTHKELELMRVYFLNGATAAKFVQDDTDHSGKLVFEIKGVRGNVHLTPDQVKTYLSKSTEI